MRSKEGLLTYAVVVLCFGACTSLSKYHEEKYGDRRRLLCPSADILHLSAFTVAPPATASPGIFRLSDHGQAELIKALVAVPPKDRMKLLAMVTQTVKKTSGMGIVDHTRVKRRVVLSLAPLGLEPANRVQEVEYHLEIMPEREGTSFHNWSRIESEFASVDLGKVTSTSGIGAPSATAAGATLTPGITRSLQEELTLKRTYAALTGVLAEKRATLYQKGSPERPLGGNIVIDIELDLANELTKDDGKEVYVDVAKLSGLSTAKKAQDDSVAWRRHLPAWIPHPEEPSSEARRGANGDAVDGAGGQGAGGDEVGVCQDYQLKVTAKARLRVVHPGAGGKTIIEGDDHIRNCTLWIDLKALKGAGPELVHWADLKFSTWNLRKEEGEKGKEEGEKGKESRNQDRLLAINLVAGAVDSPKTIIDLSTEREAHAFLSWLIEQKPSSSGYDFARHTLSLCLPNRLDLCLPLKANDRQSLRVQRYDWNFREADDAGDSPFCREPWRRAVRIQTKTTS